MRCALSPYDLVQSSAACGAALAICDQVWTIAPAGQASPTADRWAAALAAEWQWTAPLWRAALLENALQSPESRDRILNLRAHATADPSLASLARLCDPNLGADESGLWRDITRGGVDPAWTAAIAAAIGHLAAAADLPVFEAETQRGPQADPRWTTTIAVLIDAPAWAIMELRDSCTVERDLLVRALSACVDAAAEAPGPCVSSAPVERAVEAWNAAARAFHATHPDTPGRFVPAAVSLSVRPASAGFSGSARLAARLAGRAEPAAAPAALEGLQVATFSVRALPWDPW